MSGGRLMRQTSLETCPPRYLSPDVGLPNRLAAFEAIAAELGIGLVWWQRLLLERLTQYDPETMRPIYRDATVTLPRQQGKSVLTMLLVLERMLVRNQGSLFAAQKIASVLEFWQDFPWQTMERSGFAKRFQLRKLQRLGMLVIRNELTGVEMRTFAALSPSGGHGATVPLVILDEAWSMKATAEEGVRPAMRTFNDALLLAISTAGDASSAYFKDRVDRGRAAAEAGEAGPLFFAEWSAGDDDDIDDPETWWRCMPALGHTTDIESIRQERMTSGEFAWRRAGLNQWLGQASDPPIHPADWLACETKSTLEFEGGVSLALHAPPGGKYWLGVAADPGGRAALIDERKDWAELVAAVERALDARPDIRELVVDVSSPIGGYVDELARVCAQAKRQLRTLSARDVDLACVNLADQTARRTLRIERHKLFSQANQVANRKWKGNLWRIEQVSDDYDVAALYGLAFAVASARQFDARQKPKVVSDVLGIETDEGEVDAEWEALLAGKVLDGVDF